MTVGALATALSCFILSAVGPEMRRGGRICIPAEVVAQAWRSSRQARLARLLRSSGIDTAVMTLSVARSVGLMCADANHHDVVDVYVVLCARQRRHAIVTSDPDDIARVDPTVPRILV